MQPISSRVRLIRPAAGGLFSLLLSFSASAAEAPPDPLSATISVTSDYVYRGLSLSDGHPAVQASATWQPIQGLHMDGWASSIDFGGGDPTDAELSATLGYEIETAAAIFDFGATYLAYPGAPQGAAYNYVEIYGAATAAVARGEVTAALHYSPRYSGDTGPALFTDLEGSWSLNDMISAVGVIGHVHLDPRAGDDYAYWQAGLTADAWGLSFDLRYHGTNAALCTGGCVDRVALTIAKAF